MINIILFGPPGVGKSTLIGTLKTKGFSAIDLEDLYPNRIRFQIPNLVRGAFIGGADLNPRRQYPNCKKVLLYADQKHYDSRRSQRDADQPGKANQDHHNVDQWRNGVTWDYEIDTSNQSVMATARALARIWKEVNQ